MKLHLGCGKRKIPGFVNVDIDPRCEPDAVANCFTLHEVGWTGWFVDRNSVDLIYACHVLEHAGRREYLDVLKRWHEVLKPGGILRLSVPDLAAVAEEYEQTRDLHKFLGLLYGGQRDEHDYHRMGWDEASLTRDLMLTGFKCAYRYDRWKTEHADVDDYSAAYLPHMDFKNGRLMSLNMEAVK